MTSSSARGPSSTVAAAHALRATSQSTVRTYRRLVRSLNVASATSTLKGSWSRPGFVDIHTHYDGQATWDAELAPSSWHGVTSVVMGNCGVGFAPAAPDKHELLIALMEGVEDIPETALSEGLPWNWVTFPEYLDALSARQFAVDVGAQVPHAPLRVYVMGERGGDHEEDPTPAEIEEMAQLTREALDAGALGFATSRTVNHRSRNGQNIGTLTASTEELLGIGQGLKAAGKGVFQMVSDFFDPDYELALMRRLAEECQRPLSVTLLQNDAMPDRWREVLSFIERAGAEGIDMKAQVCARPPGILMGLEATLNPFLGCPSYQALASLPLHERVTAMRGRRFAKPSWPSSTAAAKPAAFVGQRKMFPLGDPPEYEPDPGSSFFAEATRRGVDVAELLYDALLEADGHALIFVPAMNYSSFTLEPSREMVASTRTLLGLSDGGAHVGLLCDASFPTYNITHWTRDRTRGEQFSLEFMIKSQTSDTAKARRLARSRHPRARLQSRHQHPRLRPAPVVCPAHEPRPSCWGQTPASASRGLPVHHQVRHGHIRRWQAHRRGARAVGARVPGGPGVIGIPCVPVRSEQMTTPCVRSSASVFHPSLFLNGSMMTRSSMRWPC